MTVGSSPTEVPFNALGRATAGVRAELDEAIARVLSSGWYVLGPEHDAFESELADYVGVPHAVAVGNGTDALQLAMTALGVSAGDTVLTAANAGGYTSTAARLLGATPVFADVDEASLLLTPATVSDALDRLPVTPRVLVITHLFGAAADSPALTRLAHDRGISVIEDCAQSLGAITGGARAASFGDIATTSFYPTKNLGAIGDGGAALTSDQGLADRLRQLRQYGWASKYRTTVLGGMNSRLDELQAAILRVKLGHLDAWNDRRRDIHRAYEAAIGAGARLVNVASPSYVGHLAVVDTPDRARAIAQLTDHGIRTDVHYPIPDHRQPVAAGDTPVELPVTEAAAERILSIPMFPELTADEVSQVSDALGSL